MIERMAVAITSHEALHVGQEGRSAEQLIAVDANLVPYKEFYGNEAGRNVLAEIQAYNETIKAMEASLYKADFKNEIELMQYYLEALKDATISKELRQSYENILTGVESVKTPYKTKIGRAPVNVIVLDSAQVLKIDGVEVTTVKDIKINGVEVTTVKDIKTFDVRKFAAKIRLAGISSTVILMPKSFAMNADVAEVMQSLSRELKLKPGQSLLMFAFDNDVATNKELLEKAVSTGRLAVEFGSEQFDGLTADHKAKWLGNSKKLIRDMSQYWADATLGKILAEFSSYKKVAVAA